jgi:hypothetical protein
VSGHRLVASESRPGAALLKRKNAQAHQAEDGINRYRREKDEAAKADWPDIAADTPGTAASTRRGSRKDANWNFSAALLSANIIFDYIRECAPSVTPKR